MRGKRGGGGEGERDKEGGWEVEETQTQKQILKTLELLNNFPPIFSFENCNLRNFNSYK